MIAIQRYREIPRKTYSKRLGERGEGERVVKREKYRRMEEQ